MIRPLVPSRTSLRAFLLVTFGWTWTLVLGAVALGGSAGHPLHLLGLLGPLLAWAWVVRSSLPLAERRRFLRRVVDVRLVPHRWWLAVVAVGVGPAALAAAAVTPFGRSGALAWDAPAGVGLLGALAFALAAGLVEEPGWRGVAQDAAGPRSGELPAALLLAALWSLWHLPLYLLDGTYQAGLGLGTSEFWSSMLVRVPLGVLLVWLVLRTRGAVVAAVVAHALGNATGELLADGLAASWVQAVLTSLSAIALWRWQPGREGRADEGTAEGSPCDSEPMSPLLLPNNDQKLAAAAEVQQVQMWRAAQTVRACVPDEEGRDELLACLGLLDVVTPAGR